MKEDLLDKSGDVSKATNRVAVTDSGEAELLPDLANVFISYKSLKGTVEAAKHSVQRRAEYVLQTLRNNGIKDSQFSTHRSLERVDDQYQVQLEINVQFFDFKVCEDVCNFLVEKLDENVVVGKPSFSHSKGKLDAVRRQAVVNAVKNARMKAEAIAQFLNQKLGSAIEIIEESSSEVVGATSTDGSTRDQGINARVEAATVHINVKVSASFEIEPKPKKKSH
eukprot:gene17121-8645_t